MLAPQRFQVGVLIVLAALTLAACGNTPTDPSAPIGPQEIVGATELLPFDATTFPTGNDAAVTGTCAASAVVPGAYRCELDTGGADEPCLALGATRVICGRIQNNRSGQKKKKSYKNRNRQNKFARKLERFQKKN